MSEEQNSEGLVTRAMNGDAATRPGMMDTVDLRVGAAEELEHVNWLVLSSMEGRH
jgi:hypothetical protein